MDLNTRCKKGVLIVIPCLFLCLEICRFWSTGCTHCCFHYICFLSPSFYLILIKVLKNKTIRYYFRPALTLPWAVRLGNTSTVQTGYYTVTNSVRSIPELSFRVSPRVEGCQVCQSSCRRRQASKSAQSTLRRASLWCCAYLPCPMHSTDVAPRLSAHTLHPLTAELCAAAALAVFPCLRPHTNLPAAWRVGDLQLCNWYLICFNSLFIVLSVGMPTFWPI